MAKQSVFTVVRHDGPITIPTKATKREAGEFLIREAEQDEQVVPFSHPIACFPWDGALAATKAMKEKFGVVVETRGSSMSVASGPDEMVTYPWGAFQVPGFNGRFGFSARQDDDERWQFVLSGQCRRIDLPIVEELVSRIKEIVLVETVYRGKAFAIELLDRMGRVRDTPKVTFMRGLKFKPEDAIFAKPLEIAIEEAVYTRITKREELGTLGNKFKSGICLAGDPGSGKTLVSTIAAKLAVENGATFVLVTNPHELVMVLRFVAQIGGPVVVAMEDIDRIASGDRDANTDQILNALDGVDTKGSQVMFLCTTNAVDTLVEPIRRPGRFDDVINVTYPDAEATLRLIHRYGKGQLTKDDFSEVASLMAGRAPAVIENLVVSARLSMVRLGLGKISPEALRATFERKRFHLDLLASKPVVEDELLIKFGKVLADGMKESHKGNGSVAALLPGMSEAHKTTCDDGLHLAAAVVGN